MLNTTKSVSDFSDLLSRFQVEFHQDSVLTIHLFPTLYFQKFLLYY